MISSYRSALRPVGGAVGGALGGAVGGAVAVPAKVIKPTPAAARAYVGSSPARSHGGKAAEPRWGKSSRQKRHDAGRLSYRQRLASSVQKDAAMVWL